MKKTKLIEYTRYYYESSQDYLQNIAQVKHDTIFTILFIAYKLLVMVCANDYDKRVFDLLSKRREELERNKFKEASHGKEK